MNLFSFIECATRTQSLRSLFELLVKCASDEGFSEVFYGALNFAEPLRLPEYPPPAVAVKWPPEWCERYFRGKYYKIDPVVRRISTRPFLWDQLAEQHRLVAKGKSSWEIGRILHISENTVNFHLKNAMRRLGATSRIQAVIVAIRLNLILDVEVA
ncbi:MULTISPECIES: LuxR family transcriptional regulator [unclassified Bradyrhizobium]|uniref:helix-turn-helix transcriptional regulator n=1 Tax=unclassified Bradyrhizobium TaxID=2631580 RepID=UPI0009394125|nr:MULTISPECIES: LuxR family transcriptional regulator [unclassified Bradyrhizobium]OKO69999.1 hypothetical protein AC630_35670 [Bradyrhizobium sp. AS23.2]OKO88953.1 hypothetical protein AC629_07750 [Bradyrhizobium sp. NAS80.1]